VKSSILEDAQKSKAKLNYRLVSTTNSIPSLVEEIQLGFSRRAKWEMDKGKHAKVAADIEDRFFKLKGLTFWWKCCAGNEFGDDFDRNISSFVVFHWIFYIGTPQWDNNLSFVCFDFLWIRVFFCVHYVHNICVTKNNIPTTDYGDDEN